MDLIPYSRQSVSDEDISLLVETLNSDLLTQGPKIAEFEKSIANFFDVKHSVVCSSGTAALHLAYAAIGVNHKSLGIVPAITFAATANAFRYQRAAVQFCDIDPETGLISLDSLEECMANVSEKQKEECNVIAPVSFAGSVAPLEECHKIAQKNNFFVVEDGCHSPGAWKENHKNKIIKSGECTNTIASTLSFHPVKHICAGEGGAVLTNEAKVAEKAKKLCNHGINRPYDDSHEKPWYYEQEDLGWNYRLTDIQATLGMSQLQRLANSLKTRRYLAKRYDQVFAQSPFKEHITKPTLETGHAWHLYVIKFKNDKLRNLAYKFFKSQNILTQIHYIPLYKHPYYSKDLGEFNLPGAESFFKCCLSIPLYPELSEIEQDRVMDTLEQFLNTK
jgi:perosamine synthetase